MGGVSAPHLTDLMLVFCKAAAAQGLPKKCYANAVLVSEHKPDMLPMPL